MRDSVSFDKQETHEDDKCKIIIINNSHIIYYILHVLFSVHIDNDITVTNNDDISTECIINTPDIQQEITTS